MREDAEAFIDALESLFGKEDAIRKIESTKPGLPAVHCFFYKDLPEPGTLTTVTYGISEATHPDWKHGRPELIVSLHTSDEAWGLAAGFIGEAARGESSFCYGQTLNLGEAISEGSHMSAFLLFAPSFLEQEQAKIPLPNTIVHLYGAYPLYPGEVALVRRIGLEKFWHLPGFDLYDIHRKDLAEHAL